MLNKEREENKQKILSLLNEVTTKMSDLYNKSAIVFYSDLWDLKVSLLKYVSKLPFRELKTEDVEKFYNKYNKICAKHERKNKNNDFEM